MQSLSKTYLSCFEQIIRQKGRQLFQAGRTQISKNSPGLIQGTCEDSGTKFKLGARIQDNELHAFCECPYFQSQNGLCRHIWAILLSVDQRGLSAFLEISSEENTGKIFADEIWMDPKKNAPKRAEDGKSWKSLINNVDRIRKSQEKMLFKAKLSYCIDLSKDTNDKTELALFVTINAAEFGKDEGNPFQNIPIERLLHMLKSHDMNIINLIQSNCAKDPLGEIRKFVLPLMVEPKLIELLSKVPCSVSYDGVPKGELEICKEEPWEMIMRIEDMATYSLLRPLLVRGKEEKPMDQVGFFVTSNPRGFYTGSKRFNLKDNVDNVWIHALEIGETSYTIPMSGIQEFLTHFSKACTGLHPRVEWPEDFWTNVTIEKDPIPLMQAEFNELGISAELMFEYQMDPSQRISAFSAQNQVLQWSTHSSCDRRIEFEENVMKQLEAMPKLSFVEEDHMFHIDHENIQEVLRTLEESGVTLYGKERKIKSYSKVQLELSSKIDWFEVKGEVDFQGEKVEIGEMLESIRSNSRYVLLGSGEYGLLPDQWIAKNKHLLEMAENKDGKLKLQKSHFLLVDQMVNGDEDSRIKVKNNAGSKDLQKLIKEAEDFNGLELAEPHKFLKADMRNYQLSGLAWLRFLKKFGFGGILADDMGLGKTVQAIASILDEVTSSKKNKQNLVVMPTSLIFNWNEELLKFAPKLNVAAYSGSDRGKLAELKADVILTTYGILRRQAEDFANVEWHYVILDEAQSIKNYRSQTATAACNLNGVHRLSLTGTPIENNLMEMWSHMQFLNPNLLGSREQFNSYVLKPDEGKPDNQSLQKLQKMVFPYILRRTKEDVLTDLPRKVEQVVQCSMGSRQQEYYNTVRDDFKRTLLDNISNKGVGSSKLKVIEGLLRLRQIACHPNLLDRNLSIPSTKLNHMLNALEEAVAEGHKVLIFSQFTSMLEIIVREITKLGIKFTYLDGQTKDRQERVRLFQEDPEISTFLISLKAGGVGLNLTAADYVFLFDPWWNPAAEAQAIDRAHRIGQTKKVFTYRLITKGTVEEKVVELQAQKRDMVKGVMTDDNEFVKKLDKNDIEYLFS